MDYPVSEMRRWRSDRVALMTKFDSSLDVLDAFIYEAHSWNSTFAGTLPFRDEDWLSPTTSRQRALKDLSEDSIATAMEISDALRFALIRQRNHC